MLRMRRAAYLSLLALSLCARPAHGDVKTVVDPGNGVTWSSEDGDFSLNLGFYAQAQFQVIDRDLYRRADPTLTSPPMPVENIGTTEPSFRLRLARVFLKGNFFYPWLKYKIEVDLAGNDEGLRSVFIPANDPLIGFNGVNVTASDKDLDGRTVKTQDFYLEATRFSYASFRVGQFKVPHGRQELVSDSRLQMTSRSIASDFFSLKRDRGFIFFGGSPTEKIQYRFGAFNGTGLAQAQNIDSSIAYVARLTATSKEAYLDVESLQDAPEHFFAQGGFSWYSSADTPFRQSAATPIGDIQDVRSAGDLEIFFGRRANLLLEYYSRHLEADYSFDLPQSCFGAFRAGRVSCQQWGLNVQTGVMFKDRHEISARYSKIDNDEEISRDEREEMALNYTYFFRKHSLKWLTSVSYFELGVNAAGSSGFDVQLGKPPSIGGPFFLDDDPNAFPGLDDDTNYVLITQVQFAF